MATALALVVLLGLGALFLSFSTEYAPEIYALLFGEVLGVSASEVLPIAVLAVVCVGPSPRCRSSAWICCALQNPGSPPRTPDSASACRVPRTRVPPRGRLAGTGVITPAD